MKFLVLVAISLTSPDSGMSLEKTYSIESRMEFRSAQDCLEAYKDVGREAVRVIRQSVASKINFKITCLEANANQTDRLPDPGLRGYSWRDPDVSWKHSR